MFTYKYRGPGSSVGIATDYGLDGSGSNVGGDEIFRPSRPALGPTQPPVKLVTGSFPGVKCCQGVLLTTHPLLVPWSWKSRAIPLPILWATPDVYRETFTFTLPINITARWIKSYFCTGCLTNLEFSMLTFTGIMAGIISRHLPCLFLPVHQ